MPGLPVAEAAGLLRAGLAALSGGRPDEALQILGRAATAAPASAAVQAALAEAHRTQGRLAVALAHYRHAAALQPDATSLTNLAAALLEAGQVSESARTYQTAFRRDQRSPELLYGWGLALRRLGRLSEAADAFSRAAGLRPAFEAAHVALAETCIEAGAWDLGLKAACDGLAHGESKSLRVAFVDCARRSPPFTHHGLDERLLQALSEGWTRPRDLARFAGAMLLRDGEVQPADPLLHLVLTLAPVADPELERRLTLRRADLLAQSQQRPAGLAPAALDEACRLARQCFINEYVWVSTPAEHEQVALLRRRVEVSLETGLRPEADHLAAVALYQPLGELHGAGGLLSHPWPPPIAAMIDQQVTEPAEEAALAAQLADTAPVLDPVAQRVRAQYEESPYPRWVALAAAPEPVQLQTWLAGRFAAAARLDERPRPDPLEVLVAGCGTGQQAVETARGFAPARLLAIDLSRRSLAYAMRMSRILGLDDIEYRQANLLQAASLGRSFDLIGTGGVLHHLADPFAGWRALCDVLRPGGVMNVLVYTERGRADVACARRWIERMGFTPSPDGIRRCRSALSGMQEAWARRLVESPDFWSTSLCRDLLFHVHERPLALPAIDSFLADAGLELIGIEVPEETERAFLAANGGEAGRLRELARWDAFEAGHPRCFGAMLNLWLRKPD